MPAWEGLIYAEFNVKISMNIFMKGEKRLKKLYSLGIIAFLLFFSSFLVYDQYNDLVELDFLRGHQAFECLDTLNISANEIKICVFSALLVLSFICPSFIYNLSASLPQTVIMKSFRILRC